MVTVNNPLDYHTYIWGDVAKMTRVYAGMLAVDTDLTLLILDLPRTDRCTAEGWEPALLAIEAAVAGFANQSNNGAMTAEGVTNMPDDMQSSEPPVKKVRAAVTVSLPENISEAITQRFMGQGIAVILERV